MASRPWFPGMGGWVSQKRLAHLTAPLYIFSQHRTRACTQTAGSTTHDALSSCTSGYTREKRMEAEEWAKVRLAPRTRRRKGIVAEQKVIFRWCRSLAMIRQSESEYLKQLRFPRRLRQKVNFTRPGDAHSVASRPWFPVCSKTHTNPLVYRPSVPNTNSP